MALSIRKLRQSSGQSTRELDRAAVHDASRHSYKILVAIIIVGYLVLATALYHIRGARIITPDRWALFLFLGAVLLGQGVRFLRDWVPFILLLFGYEYMRGIAGDIAVSGGFTAEDHGRILVEPLIEADKILAFGHVPTIWLQQHLYEPGDAHWYDVIAALVYLMHFVLPLVFAFALWVRRKDQFWQFSVALLFMTYSAFAFFLLVPAAPPWLASDWGYLDGLVRPSSQAFRALMPNRYDNLNTFTIWTHHSPNPVAAMPSLHAAFPWLVTLFAVRYFGRAAWLMLLYNAAVWFSIVYLSQHWVIDVIAGILWAWVSYLVVVRVWPRITTRLASRGMPTAAESAP
jgi:membrane-associated phospholipid phosphatase